MRLLLLFLALALQAQNAGIDPTIPVHPLCDATDWKARAEWLEQKLAITESKLAALANFYAAQEQLTGLATKEPPKPKQEEKK